MKVPINVATALAQEIEEMRRDDIPETSLDVRIDHSQKDLFEGMWSEVLQEVTVQFDILRCGHDYIITCTDEHNHEHVIEQ